MARQFRNFIRSELNDGKQRVLGYRMKCIRCGCKQGIPANNIRLGANSQEQLAKIVSRAFVNHGWTLGQDDQHDLCPRCTKNPPKQEIGTLGRALIEAGVKTPDQPQPKETTMTEKKGRITLRMKDRLAIADVLRSVAHAENGMCVYDEGWDDDRVRIESKVEGCSTDHVGYIRRELFGHVKPRSATGGGEDVEALRLELRAFRQEMDAGNDAFKGLAEEIVKIKTFVRALDQRLAELEAGLGVRPAA